MLNTSVIILFPHVGNWRGVGAFTCFYLFRQLNPAAPPPGGAVLTFRALGSKWKQQKWFQFLSDESCCSQSDERPSRPEKRPMANRKWSDGWRKSACALGASPQFLMHQTAEGAHDHQTKLLMISMLWRWVCSWLTITDVLDHQSAAAEIRFNFLWSSEELRRRRVHNELHLGSRSALITDIWLLDGKLRLQRSGNLTYIWFGSEALRGSAPFLRQIIWASAKKIH